MGPYNAKGIGENPLGPVAPAIANAVEDAGGVRIRGLPITAEKVSRALADRETRSPAEAPVVDSYASRCGGRVS